MDETEPQSRQSASDAWMSFARTRLDTFGNISSHSNASSAIDARQAVTKEIWAIHSAMRAARATLNSFTLVGRLPDEALAHIFLELSKIASPQSKNTSKSKSSSHPRLGWILVTHVSRRWRQVALENPSLWGTISFHLGQLWSEEMGRRAKHADIIIEGAGGAPLTWFPEGFDTTLHEHAWHIRSIRVFVSLDESLRVLDALVDPVPRLKTFQMYAVQLVDSPTYKARPPPNFLGGSVPPLRVLKWSIPTPPAFSTTVLPSTLTELSIQSKPMSIASYGLLLEAFRHMEDLQSLSLQGCLPTPTQRLVEDEEPLSVTRLPKLKNLRLSGEAARCQCFLDQVAFPIVEEIEFDIRDDPEPKNALPAVSLPVVNVALENWRVTPWTLDSLSIGKGVVSFSFTTRLPGEDFTTTKDVSLCTSSSACISSYIETVASMYPLRDMSSLHLLSGPCMKPEIWVSVFASAQRITHVEASSNAAETLLSALLADVGLKDTDANSDRQPTYLFPVLEKLTLNNLDFKRRSSEGFPLHQLFGQVLTVRNTVKAVPRTLELVDSPVRKEWVNWWYFCLPEAKLWWRETASEWEYADA
ncbi:hypothetical protein OF83DRAFT_197786 [Amylostereum chailletii]|nr:hypothetical protein OF83DRAFT_197786 [Amylostereum chailletii]